MGPPWRLRRTRCTVGAVRAPCRGVQAGGAGVDVRWFLDFEEWRVIVYSRDGRGTVQSDASFQPRARAVRETVAPDRLQLALGDDECACDAMQRDHQEQAAHASLLHPAVQLQDTYVRHLLLASPVHAVYGQDALDAFALAPSIPPTATENGMQPIHARCDPDQPP